MDRRTLFKATAAGLLIPIAEADAVSPALPELAHRTESIRAVHASGLTNIADLVGRHVARLLDATDTARGSDTARYAAATSDAASVASWIANDLGNLPAALAYAHTAAHTATTSADAERRVIAACRMAAALWPTGQAGDALKVLNDVVGAKVPPAVRAELLVYRARAHSAAGDAYAAVADVERADAVLEAAPPVIQRPSYANLTQSGIRRWFTRVAIGMRDYVLAEPALRQSLTELPEGADRPRGFLYGSLAMCAAAKGDPEQAATYALRSWKIAKPGHGGRDLERVREVQRALRGYSANPHVRRLNEVLADT